MATWTAAAARRGTRKARSRLTSDPHQSNRTIAHAAGVHHKTVGRLRLLLETGGSYQSSEAAAPRDALSPRAAALRRAILHPPTDADDFGWD